MVHCPTKGPYSSASCVSCVVPIGLFALVRAYTLQFGYLRCVNAHNLDSHVHLLTDEELKDTQRSELRLYEQVEKREKQLPLSLQTILDKTDTAPVKVSAALVDVLAPKLNFMPLKAKSLTRYIGNMISLRATPIGYLANRYMERRTLQNTDMMLRALRRLDKRRTAMLKYSGARPQCSHNEVHTNDKVRISHRGLARVGQLQGEDENDPTGRPHYSPLVRKVVSISERGTGKRQSADEDIYGVCMMTAYGDNGTWADTVCDPGSKVTFFRRSELCLVSGIQEGTFVRVELTRYTEYRKEIVESRVRSSSKYYQFNHSFTRSIFQVTKVRHTTDNQDNEDEEEGDERFLLRLAYDASKSLSEQPAETQIQLPAVRSACDSFPAYPLVAFEAEAKDFKYREADLGSGFSGIPAHELLAVDSSLQAILAKDNGPVLYHRSPMSSKYKTRVSGIQRVAYYGRIQTYRSNPLPLATIIDPGKLEKLGKLLTCFMDRCTTLHVREEAWSESSIPQPSIPQPNRFEVYDELQDPCDERAAKKSPDQELIEEAIRRQEEAKRRGNRQSVLMDLPSSGARNLRSSTLAQAGVVQGKSRRSGT